MNPFNDALLHVLKHSGCDVYGLLVSRKSEPQDVCGCIPLFHSRFVTAPLARTAMSILDSLSDILIVGLYYAEAVETDALPPVARWIREQIQITIKGANIGCFRFRESLVDEHRLLVWPFQWLDSKEEWSNQGTAPVTISFDHASFATSVEQNQYVTGIHDFEEHLGDCSMDWIRIASQ